MAAKTRNIKGLDDLMQGAVNERFDLGLHKVLKNAFDANTDPKSKRKIILTFTIIPDKDRTTASFDTDIKIVLAQPIPLSQRVLIAQDDEGNVVAQEVTNQVTGQIGMDGSVTIPKVLKFNNPNDQNAKEV